MGFFPYLSTLEIGEEPRAARPSDNEIICLLLDRQAGAGPFGERAVEQPRVVARLRERQVAERGARPAAAIRHDFLAVSDTGRRDLALEVLARGEQPILGPVQIAPYEIDRVRNMAGMAVEVALA